MAPPDVAADLRAALSTIEYDIVAEGVPADIAVVYRPDAATVASLRERGLKVVSLDGAPADLDLTLDEAASFKTRIWQLFEAR